MRHVTILRDTRAFGVPYRAGTVASVSDRVADLLASTGAAAGKGTPAPEQCRTGDAVFHERRAFRIDANETALGRWVPRAEA